MLRVLKLLLSTNNEFNSNVVSTLYNAIRIDAIPNASWSTSTNNVKTNVVKLEHLSRSHRRAGVLIVNYFWSAGTVLGGERYLGCKDTISWTDRITRRHYIIRVISFITGHGDRFKRTDMYRQLLSELTGLFFFFSCVHWNVVVRRVRVVVCIRKL